MIDLARIAEDENAGINLPALLSRLIEAYESSPGRARYVLQFKHLLGRSPKALKPVNKRTADALGTSDEASKVATFQKMLHAPAQNLDVYGALLRAWYDTNLADLQDELTEDEVTSWESDHELPETELKARGELLDNSHFRTELERQVKEFDSKPSLKEAIAKELGLNPNKVDGFDLALRRFQEFKNTAEQDHFRRLRMPNLSVFWAKELIGMLPLVVERSQGFTSHPISKLGDTVPKGLRVLFEQAHLCFLFDLDIPCVVTCGSLLENAFKSRFPELAVRWDSERTKNPPRYVSLVAKARHVIAHDPSSTLSSRLGSQMHALRTISSDRNRAVHDPNLYLGSGKQKSEAILRNTRDILGVLFEPSESFRKQKD